MMTIKPLRPEDIEISHAIPEFVIKAVNNILSRRYRGRELTIPQSDIIQEILTVGPQTVTKSEIFAKDYLDFEDVYGEVGWEVTYDKPGYNESYEANFKFKAK